jgi:hypothetical protein
LQAVAVRRQRGFERFEFARVSAPAEFGELGD